MSFYVHTFCHKTILSFSYHRLSLKRYVKRLVFLSNKSNCFNIYWYRYKLLYTYLNSIHISIKAEQEKDKKEILVLFFFYISVKLQTSDQLIVDLTLTLNIYIYGVCKRSFIANGFTISHYLYIKLFSSINVWQTIRNNNGTTL